MVAPIECRICFQEFSENEIWKTQCNHEYCAPCITEHLIRTEHCPTCKTSNPYPEKRKEYRSLIDKVHALTENDFLSLSETDTVKDLKGSIEQGTILSLGPTTILGHVIIKTNGLHESILESKNQVTAAMALERMKGLIECVLKEGVSPLYGPPAATPLMCALDGSPQILQTLVPFIPEECLEKQMKINLLFDRIVSRKGKFETRDLQQIRALSKFKFERNWRGLGRRTIIEKVIGRTGSPLVSPRVIERLMECTESENK